jgi:hypothetical protein
MAADPRIIQYIREQMNAGFRKQQISDALLDAGWYREEIEAAFYELSNQAYGKEPAPKEESFELHPKKPLPQKPGFFWKLSNALFHPATLADGVRNERGVGKPLLFFVLVALINSIAVFAFDFLQPGIPAAFFAGLSTSFPFQDMLPLLQPFTRTDIVGLATACIFAFVAALAGAGIIHGFAFALGGRKGFRQTFKAVMYSFAPFALLWLFILPVFVITDVAMLSLAFLAFLAALVALHAYVAIRCLSRLHEIPVAKAAGAFLFAAAVLAALLLFVLPSFIPLDTLMGMFNPSSFLPGAGTATGFGELGMPPGWQYSYDGSFSITLKNNAAVPITINSVTANCGAGGSDIVLETLDPMHLESGGGITYSSGDERCALREPGESYSVSVTVRYLQESSLLKTASGTVSGRVG